MENETHSESRRIVRIIRLETRGVWGIAAPLTNATQLKRIILIGRGLAIFSSSCSTFQGATGSSSAVESVGGVGVVIN